MKIHTKDFYYGAVLNQLAIYPTFTSINKIGTKDGLYKINDTHRILIKYSASDDNWRFEFRVDDFDELCIFDSYIVLVCPKTICLVSYSEIQEIINTESKKPQWVSFRYSGSKKMSVTGPKGDLSHKIAHNAFPEDIFYKNEDPRWPPFSELNFYEDTPNLICSTVDRYFDLADNFDYTGTVFFGLKTLSHELETWNEENLSKIEETIKYDFEFDGLKVYPERITKTTIHNELCHNEFLWRLNILEDGYEDLGDTYDD